MAVIGPKILEPGTLLVGTMPDFDGVVIVCDPGTPEAVIIRMHAETAAAVSVQLIKRCVSRGVNPVLGDVSMPTGPLLTRPRPDRLDS